jgi:hypothetical protein
VGNFGKGILIKRSGKVRGISAEIGWNGTDIFIIKNEKY